MQRQVGCYEACREFCTEKKRAPAAIGQNGELTTRGEQGSCRSQIGTPKDIYCRHSENPLDSHAKGQTDNEDAIPIDEKVDTTHTRGIFLFSIENAFPPCSCSNDCAPTQGKGLSQSFGIECKLWYFLLCHDSVV